MGKQVRDDVEVMLSGGHPNSLGRTEEVVAVVLADRGRLQDLYDAWFSDDELVRLRVASAMKRVTIAQPRWVMDFMDRLQGPVADIDQASTQWILALVFDLTRDLMSKEQVARALQILKRNLAGHDDWIVLNNSMKVLGKWARTDGDLALWLRPHAERLANDPRKSVASNGAKLLDMLASLE